MKKIKIKKPHKPLYVDPYIIAHRFVGTEATNISRLIQWNKFRISILKCAMRQVKIKKPHLKPLDVDTYLIARPFLGTESMVISSLILRSKITKFKFPNVPI